MSEERCITRPDKLGDHVGLRVKDGVREVRFNLRLGAQRLAHDAQAAARSKEGAAVLGPLALLGEPLELAVRTTARLLRAVDRAAVELLSSDGAYRALQVPLRSSVTYFDAADEPPAHRLRDFTHDHYWRYRHWLAMKGRGDVFVREQSIERAAEQLMADRTGRSSLDAGLDDRAPSLARIIRAFGRADILVLPGDAPPGGADAGASALRWQAAACVVLAGELVATWPGLATKDQTLAALALADEVFDALEGVWPVDPTMWTTDAGVARWLGFVLRHT